MATISTASISMQARVSATSRFSGVKSALTINQRRGNLSFKLRPMPSRLRISCAAKQETVDKVCKIVKEQLSLAEDQKVTPETKFSDLGADSLDTVEIVMSLEEEFGITMAEERAQKIATVEQAAELIQELVNEKAA